MAYIRFVNKVDIYTESTVTRSSGQKKPSWALSQSAVKTLFYPTYATLEIAPVTQELNRVNAYFRADANINYSDRLYNFTDRKGNQIAAGPFEVMEIRDYPGWSGKIRYKHIMLRKVKET